MRIIILIGMIIIWTVLSLGLAGISMATQPQPGDEARLMVAICIGPAIGFVTGTMLLWLMGSKPRTKRVRTSPKPRSVMEARPFRSRLAQYTHQSETEVMSPSEFRSKMSFWMAVDFFTRVPPKSAIAIRRVLRRIRALAART